MRTAPKWPAPSVSWSAIFAGAFVVIAGELLLGLLGAAVGLGLRLNLSHDGAAKRFDAAQACFEQARKDAIQAAKHAADEATAARPAALTRVSA